MQTTPMDSLTTTSFHDSLSHQLGQAWLADDLVFEAPNRTCSPAKSSLYQEHGTAIH